MPETECALDGDSGAEDGIFGGRVELYEGAIGEAKRPLGGFGVGNADEFSVEGDGLVNAGMQFGGGVWGLLSTAGEDEQGHKQRWEPKRGHGIIFLRRAWRPCVWMGLVIHKTA